MRRGTIIVRKVPLAHTLFPQTPRLLVGLFLLGFLPACASLLDPNPNPGAGEFSHIEAICTVTNPQGTVVHQPVIQFGTEKTWFGDQVPTSQVVGEQECLLPAGEQVKIVDIGSATRRVVGLGEAHCYGMVPTEDLGNCSGGKRGKQGSGRHR